MAMSRFRKAVGVTAVCVAVILAILVHATLSARLPLAANALRGIAYRVAGDLVEQAIAHGGLSDAEAAAEAAIAAALQAIGESRAIDVWRPARPMADPPFAFLVLAGDLRVWVSPEGLVDPLMAIRTGERHPILAEPHTPYRGHANESVLAECLGRRYAHASGDAPDFFARLENRTGSDGHGGFEMLVVQDGRVGIDRLSLAGAPTPAAALEAYGL
ncbi:MAG TPA: hypothetical protein VJ397_00730 [Thermoplasmata archaeon]|nr:hypothetical protein [Thermoplasmata archaeon]